MDKSVSHNASTCFKNSFWLNAMNSNTRLLFNISE